MLEIETPVYYSTALLLHRHERNEKEFLSPHPSVGGLNWFCVGLGVLGGILLKDESNCFTGFLLCAWEDEVLLNGKEWTSGLDLADQADNNSVRVRKASRDQVFFMVMDDISWAKVFRIKWTNLIDV